MVLSTGPNITGPNLQYSTYHYIATLHMQQLKTEYHIVGLLIWRFNETEIYQFLSSIIINNYIQYIDNKVTISQI